MKIVIIGDGKVGHKLTKQLSEEDYDVVLIDQNEGKLKEALNKLDILCITGDGADARIQKEAGVPTADLVVACASTDELNMLSCLLAKRLGAKHTIARVRNPIYYQQIDILKEDLRLSMAVNPELAVAMEISRIILFPDTAKVETFMKGKVELIEFIVKERSHLDGVSLAEINQRFQIKVLVCAVKRGNEVIIPDGEFVIHDGDRLHIVASHKYIEEFFRFIGKQRKVKNVLICGGGRVGYYLAKQLLNLGMQVKIIEKEQKKCEELCDMLPKATVIHGNAADHDLLMEEGIEEADALISLTGVDEENIILALFARTKGVDKIVAKVNEDGRAQLVEELGIDGIVSAKTATADAIMSYVRARQNSLRSTNVESMYQLVGGRVEALEFIIRGETDYTNIPLKELPTKANNLIACIGRGRSIIIPNGNDVLKVGDSVVVVTTEKRVQDITDIMV
ncbi:Trk system potassium transporter TrkA [Bariatricus massiliensis]|uniref:Trk system potassium uptake protein TrkA n=1 Tax=Bariatricus massiliensis TaxID=1745713 RepID=A0ABS8DEW3_9FIRM|nr:Trk system potassium transporter TrkA [Bariatricus massiliensis]MCB7303034.1 Trk system potassium transporter TrkA [Bariatricus massiliensis]MCB7374250.1 Trk system potassium transporter TrkA [Bariatricus massiliensis]MCB7386920.1 Trk system potassium transporter TrkA [Bariatricus massiliensis]MCB7411082.1 Trk system potassium transporter TrkA [Bariatricus massiliensis]MCQ5251908.1 Trk system potassium transporter TrkA [Bariatricus massiliensis]